MDTPLSLSLYRYTVDVGMCIYVYGCLHSDIQICSYVRICMYLYTHNYTNIQKFVYTGIQMYPYLCIRETYAYIYRERESRTCFQYVNKKEYVETVPASHKSICTT